MDNTYGNNAKDQIKDVTENVSDRMRDAAHSAGERMRDAKESAQERLHEAQDAARDYSRWAKERGEDFYHRIQDTSMTDVEKAVTDYVRENPGKSLIAAAGAGIVLGLLFSGGSRRH